MALLYHKLLLFLLILPSLFTGEVKSTAVAAMLVAVTASALCSYLEKTYAFWLCLGFCMACVLWTPLLPFVPLAAYDCAGTEKPWSRWLWVIPLFRGFNVLLPPSFFSFTVLSVLAVFLYRKEMHYQSLLLKYHQVRDDTVETAILLREKNRELMKNQDYEVELATLAERNRIAREIHDNVGHLLTRSILQVSALQVLYGQSPELNEQIGAVRSTLTDAMDHVRQSVHNLHDESLDLKQQVSRLIEDFTFCRVELTYDSGKLPKEMNYAVIAIIKEALSNIARHSNATLAAISILEHPSLYQIQIRDNGTCGGGARRNAEHENGIGLTNMEERVRAFHGIFHIDRSSGFKIFITLPKDPDNETYHRQ